MTRSSGAMGTSLPALSRLGVVPTANANRLTTLADSRGAAVYIDPAKLRYNMRSPLNWVRLQSGQRIVIGDTFGVSGERTDQIMARVNQAIASGARICHVWGGVNNHAQNYPSASTSGQTAAADNIAVCELLRQANVTPILEQEIGAENLTAAQMAQVMIQRQAQAAYAAAAGIWLSDSMATVMNPYPGTGTTTFKPGFSLDGTHLNSRGAYAHAVATLIPIIEQITARRPSLLMNTTSLVPANGRLQLIGNPVFATATGGTLGTGMTGTVPAGWTVDRLGSVGAATATVSTQPSADGVGNDVVIAATFTAAGDRVVLRRDVAIGDWMQGDIIQAVAGIRVNGAPVNLAAVTLQIQVNGDNATTAIEDGYHDPSAGSVGPASGYAAVLATRPFTVPTYTSKGYIAVYVFITAAGPGSANVTVRQVGIHRRASL